MVEDRKQKFTSPKKDSLLCSSDGHVRIVSLYVGGGNSLENEGTKQLLDGILLSTSLSYNSKR